MAELAIPIIALGGLYIASNQKKEGYINMGAPKNALANVVPPPIPENYPVTKGVDPQTNVEYYPNPNQATDEYFQQNVFEKIEQNNPEHSVGGGVIPQMSLTGTTIDKTNFKHNNMVPFFGGKIKGATSDFNARESTLDNMIGTGSQQITKGEHAPLFKPQAMMQHAHGAPNMSDFYQSRVNPSIKMSNIKPWDEQHVGPGLNQGYTAAGSKAGFNSGLEARDSYLPKTVNELRVDTNPKMTFGLEGHQGPAVSSIKESSSQQTMGRVEKYAPDTYYTVGKQRWFTTTGAEKAPTVRGIEVLQHTNRPETCGSYYGAGGGENEASYIPGEYQQSRKPTLPAQPISNANASEQNPVSDCDYGANSYHNMPNNRSTTKSGTELGGVGGVLKAMFSPLLDVARPSRKEDVIGNLRPTGNAGSTVSNTPVYNPADRTKTTIREMTESKLDGNHMNLERQSGGAYRVSKQIPVAVQRDTTTCQYTGNAGPNAVTANRTYDAEYRQRNNPNKSYINRPNQGGTQIFNQSENIAIHKRDNDRKNKRAAASYGGPSTIPSTDTYGKIHAPQYYNECYGCDRINPDILTAFKQNPYTQSIHSWS